MSSDLVRVVAADRQPLFREAMSQALGRRPNFAIVAEAADGRTALELIRQHRPHVAVVDLHLAELDGFRVLDAVVRDELPTRVLLITHAPDGAGGYDAIAAGAAGWLSRMTGEAELCAAVAAAARGDVVLPPDVQTAIAAEVRRRAGAAPSVLSERERRILEMVADGRSAAEIGQELHLSATTVKAVLAHLYRRLGVSERAAAVAAALRRGLIE